MSDYTNNNSSSQYGSWLSSPPPGEEVVITGVSGRLPKSDNIHQFRDNLFSKKDMVAKTADRWEINHPEIPQRFAQINNLDKLDAGYFGLHHRQADSMDSMMKIFLESAIEAIMDAGVNPSELEGSKTGVFTSVCLSEMANIIFTNMSHKPQNISVTGCLASLLSNRLSYHLKLKGPSFNTDTACSSSFNALDSALRAIRSGQCDRAIVGSANVLIHPGSTLQFFRLGVLSHDGVCKVFDENADGYVRGEAVVCIFLQKAKDSRRIYAQIVNIKVNDDGFKEQGITFPSRQMQKQLMTEVYEECGLHPNDLSYLEAHGTGTQVGDPEEVEAIDSALASKRDKPLLIGSVKANIGHTEPVSGLCSLVKVIIAMEEGLIAPNINLKKIRKSLYGIEEGRMKIVTELTPLEKRDAVVGINNFGFGGNNVHVILRRFDKKKANEGVPLDNIPRLVCASGRTEEAVSYLLGTLRLDSEYIGLLHQIYRTNINGHLYRGHAIISENGCSETSTKLFAFRRSSLYVYFGKFQNNYKVVGLFLLSFPTFKNTISRINQILFDKKIKSVEAIFQEEVGSDLNILGSVVVQLGIVDIFKLLELQPIAVYGNFWGKLATEYYYDVYSLKGIMEKAISIACTENESITIVTGKGTRSKYYDVYFMENDKHFKTSEQLPTLLSKETIILNISDTRLNEHDVQVADDNGQKFLETLGRLYNEGHNFQLQKLYPHVNHPVSKGTPMISPNLQWNHSKSWHLEQFTGFTASGVQQVHYSISSKSQEHKFITGHVVDGRNLFPATGYLNLAWETLARSRNLLKTDLSVVFENCRFLRAVTIPEGGLIKLLVTIQLGTGNFEILEKDSLIVRGRIYTCDNICEKMVDLEPPKISTGRAMEHDEVYKELYLRGYNYSGLFKGIFKCDAEVSTALIKWEDNWISFMDKMLQMKILQTDTRMLYVPVEVKQITLDPSKLVKKTYDSEVNEFLVPVYFYKECDIIKTEGIEICGLHAKSIAKRKQRLEPVLEKYEFVPNQTSLELTQAIRVNTQIILENSLESHFKAVEVDDEFTEVNSEFLLPLVCKSLDDVPLVTPELTISSKKNMKAIPGIKNEDVILTPESSFLLIVGTKILQRPNLSKFLEALSPRGYILTREDIHLINEHTQLNVVTEFTTSKEKLILLSKSENVPAEVLKISSDSFKWLSQLRNSMKLESNILIYSQGEEAEGSLGFINCIRREPYGHKVKCFLISDKAPEFDPRDPFYAAQIRKNIAINVYREGKWGTYRHLPLEELGEVECEHCYGSINVKGDLSSMKWMEGPLIEQTLLQKNHVLISTYYSALNFKDVVIASGRISLDSFISDRRQQECALGIEFAGKDSTGRRLMGMVNNRALSNYVVSDADLTWDVPGSWTLEDAATVPVVYSTVIYALFFVKELRTGSSILIHSATGGIGLAALNVCLYKKCNIFVTVGTEEKREYLRKHYPQISECHIGNSRDTSFETMIKTETRNRGVDIVLNSLSEDKLLASLRCLANGGCFLEIGKYDIVNNTHLDLDLMKRGISYHGVMLDQIIGSSSKLKSKLRNFLNDGIQAGYVKPLRRVVFPMDELEPAFRYMTTGKHMGKVLMKIRDEDQKINVSPSKKFFKGFPRFSCHSEKSYVIVGGLGGVGLELADWLILRGATKLVLVSRSGVQTGYQSQRIQLWKSYGVQVEVSCKDVTSKMGCFDVIEEAQRLGPVDAVFNLAAVLKDALFEDQTEESFYMSFAPKARTTLHLDEITRSLCPELRYFVVFSSVSCGRGNAGQTNYGMANSIMERICERRKRDGFPALAIQWGAIGDVGLVAKMQKENRELVIGGTLQQKISSCFEVLDRFLKQNNPVVSSMLVAEKRSSSYGLDSAVDAVATVLGIKDIKTVSQHVTLAELGMDSMMGTEIIQLLEKDFEIYVTTKDIRSMTFAKLIEIEAESKISALQNTANKIELGTNFFIQYIPDKAAIRSPVIHLPSLVKDGEKAKNVFLLCGIEAVFKPLEALASQINAVVLGVQYNYDNPEDSIQELAKNISKHIEPHLNKTEDFLLIGYSFGSIVSIEVAGLLEDRGYTGRIVLIDGSPTYLISAMKKYFFFENDSEFQTALVYKLLEMVAPLDNVTQYKDKLLHCSNLSERLDLILSLIPPDLAKKQKLEKQAGFVLYKHIKSLLNYKSVHKKIKSKIYLLKAKYPMVDDEQDYQLSKLCEQEVVVTSIDGDHAGILNKQELAQYINKYIT